MCNQSKKDQVEQQHEGSEHDIQAAAASQMIRTKLNHSNEQLFGSALFLMDHNKVV
jgi:hypothetical protein